LRGCQSAAPGSQARRRGCSWACEKGGGRSNLVGRTGGRRRGYLRSCSASVCERMVPRIVGSGAEKTRADFLARETEVRGAPSSRADPHRLASSPARPLAPRAAPFVSFDSSDLFRPSARLRRRRPAAGARGDEERGTVAERWGAWGEGASGSCPARPRLLQASAGLAHGSYRGTGGSLHPGLLLTGAACLRAHGAQSRASG
jgi:hypothetical protein